jgi:hypothetical protein
MSVRVVHPPGSKEAKLAIEEFEDDRVLCCIDRYEIDAQALRFLKTDLARLAEPTA